jgi:hypothetical protein
MVSVTPTFWYFAIPSPVEEEQVAVTEDRKPSANEESNWKSQGKPKADVSNATTKE